MAAVAMLNPRWKIPARRAARLRPIDATKVSAQVPISAPKHDRDAGRQSQKTLASQA